MSSQLVLFACTYNAGRSQVANAFFNQLADPAKAHSIAAGLEPAERVQDEVVDVMREVGIDLTEVRPVALTGRMLTELDFLVTLGCPERCPTIPPARRQDWRPGDPRGQSVAVVREIRDEIRGLVVDLIEQKNWGRDEKEVPRPSATDNVIPFRRP
jgi:arsenate reductase